MATEVDWTAVGTWVRRQRDDVFGWTREQVVVRAKAAGGKISVATLGKVEHAEDSPPKPSTIRAVELGLGCPGILRAWIDGGAEPDDLERPPAEVVDMLPGVKREFDELRERVGRIEAGVDRMVRFIERQDEGEAGA